MSLRHGSKDENVYTNEVSKSVTQVTEGCSAVIYTVSYFLVKKILKDHKSHRNNHNVISPS